VHLKKSLLEKMPGDDWQKFASVRLLIGYQYTHPGKKLLFMGAELGQRAEWNEITSIAWQDLDHESHRGLNNFVRDIAHLYKSEPALSAIENSWEGFQWVNANDSENSVLSFIRRGPQRQDEVVVICNFTPVPRYNYRIPVPHPGYYREVLNSDAGVYWGSNVGNAGGVWAVENAWGDSGWELSVTVPPLGMLILKPDPGEDPQLEAAEPTTDQSDQAANDPLPQVVEPSEPSISLEDIDARSPLLPAEAPATAGAKRKKSNPVSKSR
jgi:1,4-alpha-glucan branching enzyme